MDVIEVRAFVGTEPSQGAASFADVDELVAHLRELGDAHGVAIQAFDARYVAGRQHLGRAVKFANRARERGDPIADDRAVEILLYAAGRRQINRALEMGIGPGETPVVVIVDGENEADAANSVRDLLAPAATLNGDPGQIRAFFGIGEPELAATDASLEDLVCERVALLEVEK